MDLFFGYSNWPVYSLVIIIILLSNILNNFENFLLTFVNGHNGDRSPTFGSMNRRSTTRLQHQSLLITVYFSVIAILLPNFVCFQWNKLAICGEAYCYTFWQEKRVYLYICVPRAPPHHCTNSSYIKIATLSKCTKKILVR